MAYKIDLTGKVSQNFVIKLSATNCAIMLTLKPSCCYSCSCVLLLQVAFVAGVADSSGYGWAICKALAEAGATVTVGTWPPVLGIFQKSLQKGSFKADSELADGSFMEIAKASMHFCLCFYDHAVRRLLIASNLCLSADASSCTACLHGCC
jgi:hypothetical protein